MVRPLVAFPFKTARFKENFMEYGKNLKTSNLKKCQSNNLNPQQNFQFKIRKSIPTNIIKEKS